MTQIRVGVNADPQNSVDIEHADSVEVGIKNHTYVISANDEGHLVIKSIDQRALRVEGFDNQVKGRNGNDRIVQGEIIVGNTVVLS